MEISEKVLMKDWAWWKIGGPADYFCLPTSLDDMRAALEFARSRRLPITILGGGTNVLISDQGIAGLVIAMKKFNTATVAEEGGRISVECLAGTPKAELTKIYMKRKLAPALFLCGLPGDVGGGIVMNAGIGEKISPREFVEIVDWVEVMDFGGVVKRYDRRDLVWNYRHTEGWQPGVVVAAGVSWPNEPDDSIPTRVREATKNRLARQPLDLPSCGSTFKNPPGHHSGALIERAGLKSYQLGGAMVSPKHANFIVNVGGAKASDVHAVITHVRGEVKRQFGVELETEVKYMGRW